MRVDDISSEGKEEQDLELRLPTAISPDLILALHAQHILSVVN